ncbi:single-stranded-DNA-specific exonuclease RecJ [uncultured Anaerococcus sp.]|uniref:single-stranded-DNA-specific exonuclease RecJ n=1 Tax=uncultured Anaerococcus sp. TaxID=293428 RepID=UPI0025FED536|nr:single-stranded-DNA-specific exonuclease RecJ [uncultured Anaerococcus sp.]
MANWFIYNKKQNYINNYKLPKVNKLDALILGNRDIIEPKKVDMFLEPNLEKLHDPFLLNDMDVAVDLIIETMKKGGEIRIFGDYDQDGIASVMTLMDGLLFYYDNISYDIPHRVDEGYGISSKMSEKAIADGVSLVITCDNGITGFGQVENLRANNINVIVTDHHQIHREENEERIEQILPDANAVINPKRLDSTYPFDDLCGAGVSFKLIQGLYQKLDGDMFYLFSLLEYVAMGTVCDIVSLTDENRIFVIEGLKRLNQTEKIGLKALLDEAGWDKEVDEYTIGFILGPLMNSTGRLRSAKLAIDLLVEEDIDKIYEMARDLVDLNNERKSMTETALKECLEQIEENSYDKDDVIVIYAQGINESICGIVAGRIKEKYYRPTIVLTDSKDKTIAKGSGRSIPAYNIYENISPFSKNLESFGGHPMACGLSIEINKIEDLREKLNQNSKLKTKDKEESINIDTQIPISKLSLEFAEMLNKYKPFGKDNPKPIFANKGVDIAAISMIGKDKNTMKLSIFQNGIYYNAIKFQAEDDYKYLNEKFKGDILRKKIDIVYYPDINEFRGNKSLQLKIIDIR